MTECCKNKKISKKLVNDPKCCVLDSLTGFVLSHSNVKLLQGCNAVVRSDIQQFKHEGKVATITGGGSGHEPFTIGYVGKGLLTASVAGDVFAAPSTKCVVQAVNNCYTDAGVLLIVTNYTGDRLTFGKAAEIVKSEGKYVDMVVVGDDCALSSKDKSAGRRGLCGTVFIHKLAGAMAEDQIPLNEITLFLREATKEMCTISVSLSPCSIPGKPPGFTIEEDMLEFGLGIHGEAGIAQIKMEPAMSIVAKMIEHMKCSGYMPSMEGEDVALIVNNLGGTSTLELSIMAKEALTYLNGNGVSVKRCYVGTFVTSLEMAGVSLTIMLLDNRRLKYLDAPCESSIWPQSGTINTFDITIPCVDNINDSTFYEEKAEGDGILLYHCIKDICNVFLENEEHLNELDRSGGDGDTGTTFAKCAKSLLAKFVDVSHVNMPVNNPRTFLLSLAGEVEVSMGGSSGALISLFLTAAANGINNENIKKEFVKSFELGITAIEKYGGAKEGDRTMLDAMYPALRALHSCSAEESTNGMLSMAAKASRTGANSTVSMQANAGRASYVSDNRLVSPDPGAVAIALMFESISKTCVTNI